MRAVATFLVAASFLLPLLLGLGTSWALAGGPSLPGGAALLAGSTGGASGGPVSAPVPGSHGGSASGGIPFPTGTGGPARTPSPAPEQLPQPFLTGPPTTEINGSAHINGSLTSSSNYLSGYVHIVGQTSTRGWTQTQGWADYGPTVTSGTMSIVPTTPGGTLFATHGGSSLWVDPTPSVPTALALMQGNLALGNSGTGGSLLMAMNGGTTLTIDAVQAGGIYSYPSGNNNLNSGGNIVVTNFGNSTGSVTLNCNIILVCPVTVSPGSTFTPPFGVSASSASITWGANTHFSITGTTTSGGAGVTATMPDTRMDVTIPQGGNLSLTPGGGSPSLTVAPGATWPAMVVTAGHVTVSQGEHLNAANVTVAGAFQAVQNADNGGTFYNDGGLNITGQIDAAGFQVFRNNLTIGTSVNITSYPGQNITNTGTIDIDNVAQIQGLSASSGTLNILGTLDQGPSTNVVTGTVSVLGTMYTQGYVSTTGSTLFVGNVSTSGDISLPSAYVTGTLSLLGGSFLGQGTTALSGTTLGVGRTTVTTTGYSTVGNTTITGTVQSTGTISVNGTSIIATAPGAYFHLTNTVQMGVTSSGGWTSQVVGSVFTQGTSFSNGSADFSSTQVHFPPGLTVHGTAWTSGNVTVLGSSVFSGSVATTGVAHFPGTTLVGDFDLAAPGAVSASGTSWVEGNVSLVGVLSIGIGLFQEDGATTITGNMDITGPSTISGNAVIATGPSGALHLDSTILMGAQGTTFTSRVIGSVMTRGTVYANGTSTFTATTASFPPGLSVHGDVSAQGNVTVLGTTLFQGSVATSGVSRFPGAVLVGTFTLPAPGSVTETGTSWVQGNVTLSGLLSVTSSSFSEVGSSAIVGDADLSGPVTLSGDGYLDTSGGGAFHMTGTIHMGSVSTVVGTVMTQGVVFANGTSTFDLGSATFPVGLTIHGTVDSQGNTSVTGGTDFTGAVTTSGLAQFPGMTLSGTFALSAQGGSVNATGTSLVVGNISLQGDLSIGSSDFREVGDSVITGNMVMTGTVVVNGDSTLTTSPGTLLELTGNIQLATAAHIIGNVNTSGDVTISGSAVLTSTSVVIGGSMALNGWVTSRGEIALSGTADFLGPVLTQGHTSLSGLSVAGNFSLHWGEFRLTGTVQLNGSTVSEGSVIANSSGYFVVGSSRIEGTTTVNGAARVQGASSTLGSVVLNGGSQFGTYMVVNGDLNAGGLDLHGPIVLPDDTVTFSSSANLTGSIWENGVLESQGGTTTFVGQSIINGTVTSPGSPSVDGPVVLPLGGSPFALTLGPTFYLLVALLLILPVIPIVEALRALARRRRPLSEHEREAVRSLRPLVAFAGVFLLLGVGVGLGGAYYLGSVLSSVVGVPMAGNVADLEVAASAVLLLGVLLWVVERGLYRSRRRRAREDGAPPSAEGANVAPLEAWDPPGPPDPGAVVGGAPGQGPTPFPMMAPGPGAPDAPPAYGAPDPANPWPPQPPPTAPPAYAAVPMAPPPQGAFDPAFPPFPAAPPPGPAPSAPPAPPPPSPVAMPGPRAPMPAPGPYLTERQRRAMQAKSPPAGADEWSETSSGPPS